MKRLSSERDFQETGIHHFQKNDGTSD